MPGKYLFKLALISHSHSALLRQPDSRICLLMTLLAGKAMAAALPCVRVARTNRFTASCTTSNCLILPSTIAPRGKLANAKFSTQQNLRLFFKCSSLISSELISSPTRCVYFKEGNKSRSFKLKMINGMNAEQGDASVLKHKNRKEWR